MKVTKVTLRVTEENGSILEREFVGSVNIGFRYLSSNGSSMALSSTGTHEA